VKNLKRPSASHLPLIVTSVFFEKCRERSLSRCFALQFPHQKDDDSMLKLMRTIALMLFAVGIAGSNAMANETEKKVSLDQVPGAVKKAIERAIGKGRLVDIGEVSTDGTITYEIEAMLDGQEVDIVLDGSGMVASPQSKSDKPSPKRAGKAKKGIDAKDEDGDEESGVKFQHSFNLENREFSSTGSNRYFVLEPGFQLTLAGKDGDEDAELIITVLNETKEIGKIETRIVEERESVGGKIVEISRNFFAICDATNTVFYFGEEVDMYRDGKVVEHAGAWLHGQDKATAGIAIPGECLIGAAYYQENAPGKAMDRARIEEVNETIKTPAGKFAGCLKVWEENPLDGDSETKTKTFAPGIGLVQDEGLLLVKHGFVLKN